MIFSEYPAVKYPQWKTVPVCPGCYIPIQLESCIPCKICNWPMCSEKCSKTEDHSLECGIFEKQGLKIDFDQFKNDENRQSHVPLFDIIIPLRMLALRNNGTGNEILQSHFLKYQ